MPGRCLTPPATVLRSASLLRVTMRLRTGSVPPKGRVTRRDRWYGVHGGSASCVAAGVWLQPQGVSTSQPPPLQQSITLNNPRFSRFEVTEFPSTPLSILPPNFISVESITSPRCGKVSYSGLRCYAWFVEKITKPDSHKPQHFCFIVVRAEAHLLDECGVIVAKWKIICGVEGAVVEVDEKKSKFCG